VLPVHRVGDSTALGLRIGGVVRYLNVRVKAGETDTDRKPLPKPNEVREALIKVRGGGARSN
jgi:hypothetical protein